MVQGEIKNTFHMVRITAVISWFIVKPLKQLPIYESQDISKQ